MTVQPQKMTTATESRRALGSSYSFAYPDAGWGAQPGRGTCASTAPTLFPLRSFNITYISSSPPKNNNLQPRLCVYSTVMLHVITSFHDHVVRLLVSFCPSTVYPMSIDGEGGIVPLMKS